MRYWVLAFLMLVAWPARSQQLPSVHLRVVGGLGQTSQFKNFEAPFWGKELAERSAGRITAEVTPYDLDGLSGPELLQFTRLGAITIGDVPLAQVASEDPEVAGVDMPGLNPDIKSLRRSIEAYHSILADLYRERYGVELLAVWTNPAQVVFCNRPIHGLADLKGLKVRVASAMHSDFVEGLGAIGITTPYSGLMDALRKHVADCAITGAISGYQIGLPSVTSYVSPVTVSWGPNILIANHDAWHRFDPAVRHFLTGQIDGLGDKMWQAAQNDTQSGLACLTDGPCDAGPPAHMKLVPVTDDDRRLVRQSFLDTVSPRWADRCGADCVAAWNRTVGRLFDISVAAQD
ncbi:MAG TPA: TRAP transporter substrate-binding protein [Stellaceae bacterium]|nr:TRAP transporter substrate-binding protein [Stellaceae bacterium]